LQEFEAVHRATGSAAMKIAELFDVRGVATIVTGGASGIGLACAEVMHDNGARVCLVDRDEQAMAHAVEKLGSATGRVVAAAADVTDRIAIGTAIDHAVKQFGRLDVAFINAGTGGSPGFMSINGARNPQGAIENVPEDLWRTIVRDNLTSVFLTLQAVVPHMRNAGKGSIIVTTSVAGVKTENFVGHAYLASKAGAAHLVRQVALELARYNIRVNSMAPGSMLTGIGKGRMHDPEVQHRFANANPMRRVALPDEIQGLALYLASPASSYVTGAQFLIDGGGAAGMAELEL
jgi:NAD(P)-dependent dehydrogenase (short-subunit alcohol dehydrogenase family)